ncbi:MAG: BON domain-containing protein [Acidobacteria bacterium]|nr:BON domain-containing protein [Acidobacteriota bacterium]
MKIRSAGGASAGVFALLLALGAAGCGDKDNSNANNSNAAHNTNTTTTAATPTATATPVTASEDNAIKNKTEAALSKAGVSGVTVEVKEGVVTLKGDVPKAKWPDAMKAANESGAKKVNNQLNDKK